MEVRSALRRLLLAAVVAGALARWRSRLSRRRAMIAAEAMDRAIDEGGAAASVARPPE